MDGILRKECCPMNKRLSKLIGRGNASLRGNLLLLLAAFILAAFILAAFTRNISLTLLPVFSFILRRTADLNIFYGDRSFDDLFTQRFYCFTFFWFCRCFRLWLDCRCFCNCRSRFFSNRSLFLCLCRSFRFFFFYMRGGYKWK